MVHQNNKMAFFLSHIIQKNLKCYCEESVVLAYASLLKHCTGVWVDANMLHGCYGVLCGC